MNQSIDIERLAVLLAKCPRVLQFDSKESPEAWALAHALGDIAESCDKISRNLLPALIGAKDEQTTEESLHEIGEELRHVLYHLEASRFYRYLREEED
jgi:hypothetical protein